jgi:DNA-binding transcriptional LysR family regulator
MTLEDMGPALARFRAEHPDVTFRLRHGENREAERLLAAGGAAVALAIDPGPGVRGDAESHGLETVTVRIG